jgi:hypothetical protein
VETQDSVEASTNEYEEFESEQLERFFPPKMRVWPLVELGSGDFNIKFTAVQLKQLISVVVNMYGGAVAVAKERDVGDLQKQNAYSTAVATEKLYDTIMDQLKLYKPDRVDVN